MFLFPDETWGAILTPQNRLEITINKQVFQRCSPSGFSSVFQLDDFFLAACNQWMIRSTVFLG